jgi:anti-sigma factor RsiW
VTHDIHTGACPGTGRLQDFLEALLPDDQMTAMAAHVADCPHCLAEQARFERLFDVLGELPLPSAIEVPSPALAERVLDQVFPARRWVRWSRRLGIGYAAALAGSLGTAAVLAMQPSGRTFLAWVASAAPSRLLDAARFLLDAVAFVAIRLSTGWGLVSTAGSHVSPLGRALLATIDQPVVQAYAAASALACVGVLLWLKSRRSRGGMTNVGVLGF